MSRSRWLHPDMVLSWPIALVAAGSSPAPHDVSVGLMVRIEIGFHSGAIKATSTNASGRYLAPASLDKTACVCGLSTGRLVRIRRLSRTAVGLAQFIGHVSTVASRAVIAPEHGAVVFAGSSGNQRAGEQPDWGNGALTKMLIEGLQGTASAGNHRITLESLSNHVTERVRQLSNEQQTPVMRLLDGISDFAVAVR